jgi:Mn-dependent DtxR family transcriptional regulator
MNQELLKKKGVSGNAKLLYIYLLDNDNCTLKNHELASMFDVTPVSITLWISRLESLGYIRTIFEKRKRTIVVNRPTEA